MNARPAVSSSPLPTLIGTMASGLPVSDPARRARDGISALHGAHQLAQKLTIVTLPLNSARVWAAPAPSWNGTPGGAGPRATLRAAIWPVASGARSPLG